MRIIRIDPMRPRKTRKFPVRLIVALAVAVVLAAVYLSALDYRVAKGRVAKYGREPSWALHTIAKPGMGRPNDLFSAALCQEGKRDLVVVYPEKGRVFIALRPTDTAGRWDSVALSVPGLCAAAAFTLDDGRQALLCATKTGLSLVSLANQSTPTSPSSWEVRSVATREGGYENIQSTQLFSETDYLLFAPKQGYCLFSPPKEGDRALSRWKVAPLAGCDAPARQLVVADINGDGNQDIVLLRGDDELSVLYNPGVRDAAWDAPRKLFESPPGLEVGGMTVWRQSPSEFVLLLHTQHALAKVTRTRSEPLMVSLSLVPKELGAQAAPGPLLAGDLTGTGKNLLAGALAPKGGRLASGKMSLFLTDPDAKPLENFGLLALPIKWSDGTWAGFGGRGESFTMLLWEDLTNDGAPDLVALCTGYRRLRPLLELVWLENPGEYPDYFLAPQ